MPVVLWKGMMMVRLGARVRARARLMIRVREALSNRSLTCISWCLARLCLPDEHGKA